MDMNAAYFKLKPIVLFTYVLVLHLVVVGLIWSPELYSKISYRVNNGLNKIKIDYNRAAVATMLRKQVANADGNTVLFIGDSLVQGLNTSRFDTNVLNLGIGHDQIHHVEARLKSYPNSHKTKALIISVGINDLYHEDLKKAQQRYIELFTYLKRYPQVLIHGILPVDPAKLGQQITRDIVEFNDFLQDQVSTMANVDYIAPPPGLSLGANSLAPIYHVGDGLHLNSQGNEVWLQYLAGRINEYAK